MTVRRVLIADDEPNIVVSLEFLLRSRGYEVSVARDGEQTLAEVARQQPDLLLLDAMMPLLDGFEVCRRLREEGHTELKIVMLTAKGRPSEVSKGLGLGADAYVTKPFSTRELLDLVRELLDGTGDAG